MNGRFTLTFTIREILVRVVACFSLNNNSESTFHCPISAFCRKTVYKNDKRNPYQKF